MTAQACQQHPEQAAVGICVRCGASFCDACLTKLDGINHCRSCLVSLALAPGEDQGAQKALPTPSSVRSALAWLWLGLGVVLLAALALRTIDAVLPVAAP